MLQASRTVAGLTGLILGHAVNQFTIPYQLTGDWYILAHELNNAFGLAGMWAVAGGTGLDNQWVGAHGAGNDERSIAWALMHQGILVMLIPDSATSTSTDTFKVLGGLTKPDAETWLAAQWTSTGGGAKTYFCAASPSFFECPGTIYSPGVFGNSASCPAGGTCNPGFTDVSTPDARYLGDNPGPGIGFMNGYFQNAFGEIYELGMCDANCAQTYLWYMQGQSYVTDTTTIGSPIVVGTAEGMQTIQTSGFPCTWLGTGSTAPTWACIYSASQVTTNLSVQQASTRYPSGTATLSGTSGTITVTMPASNLLSNGGTSFYTGGFSSLTIMVFAGYPPLQVLIRSPATWSTRMARRATATNRWDPGTGFRTQQPKGRTHLPMAAMPKG